MIIETLMEKKKHKKFLENWKKHSRKTKLPTILQRRDNYQHFQIFALGFSLVGVGGGGCVQVCSSMWFAIFSMKQMGTK